ncbi:TRAP transporter substrate-binding protein [Paenibacillus sp. CGMCC 1.16610]|uniref:DctP family TRAP transporter solute-binding subunit n=2 Tax=Paenibacillus TaxID=44249 RepID=A0ABW9U6A2_9BACL|nr:TRAP transporter substrate-binding protein [Paenibacillus anseongense]MBA2938989.1 TRAP transporter substrate-binding protein [Paenibacillus sp. CGMCC 1.16610]MVQ34951.1 DctP family TRAP transporter solute-binding subunit [Paenibacillus anseongense]
MALMTGTIISGCSTNQDAKSNAQGSTGETKKSYTFRLADSQPPDYPTTMGDKKFAELVNQKSDGRIKIDVFPSAQLGEEKAVIEQVQLGALDFTRVSTGPMAEFNKSLGVFSLPYIFDNDEHEWKFLQGADGQKLLDGLSASKFVGLAYYDSGARHFYSRKPITNVSDLKGQKIRVQQNKINIDLIEALGGSATPMPFGDVFNALQTGVIDAAENNWPSFDTSNHYQVAKNIGLDGHQRVPEVLMMSKVVNDKLSEEDKKIIKEAAMESVSYQRDQWKQYEKKSEDKVRAAGTNVVEVKDLKPWQAAVKPVIDKYRPEYKDVLDAIDKARTAK